MKAFPSFLFSFFLFASLALGQTNGTYWANTGTVNAGTHGPQPLNSILDASGTGTLVFATQPSEIAISPTVTANTYTAGYVIGGAQNLTGILRNSGTSGATLKSIVVEDTNGSASAHVPYQFLMFNTGTASLTGTYTDHAAAGISVADLGHLVHSFNVGYTNYQSPTGTVVGATPVFADVATNEPFVSSGTNGALSCVVVATGTGVAYSGTTGVLTFRYGFEKQ